MYIDHIKCDLLTANVEVIAHCANCFCNFGSGIAKQIKEKYPEMYSVDCRTIKGDKNKLGTISFTKIQDINSLALVGVNLYGQYNYGTSSRKLNYEAIYTSLERLKNLMLEKGWLSVGFPYKMGCALAGGNWDIVYKMIEVIFKDTNISILICEI